MDLYTAAQTRELDRLAMRELGISGAQLMARAARAAFAVLLDAWPDAAHIHVVCGTGNNGGDGYMVAELAAARALPVTVHQVGDAARIGGDALLARQRAERAGARIQPWSSRAALEAGLVVDALLGTGLSGPVRPAQREAIDAINASGLPVLSLDIPSGLGADSGQILGAAVRATRTATFIGFKQGLLTGAGPELCGRIDYADLQVPPEVFRRVPARARRLELESLLGSLAPRPRDAHKGQCGSVLVMGGGPGMGGAALLAAEAAARCGAGLVSAATRPGHVAGFLARRPELMCHGVRNVHEAVALAGRATAIAVGPGLGQSPWSEQLLYAAAQSGKPLVVDADALNLLAQGRVVHPARRDDWVLTPHPGEAARLLRSDAAAIQADRFGAARELQSRYGGVALLKGAGSLIAAADGMVSLSPYGTPGMASGGMGDALSGVLAALLAQGLAPLQACRLGVCLHGRAAEIAAQAGERGLLAGDLMAPLQALLG